MTRAVHTVRLCATGLSTSQSALVVQNRQTDQGLYPVWLRLQSTQKANKRLVSGAKGFLIFTLFTLAR